MPEASWKEAAAQGIGTRECGDEGFGFSAERSPAIFTVSEVLQRARLDQGIDLAKVAAGTKIKAKYLQAIEAGDRKSLPGGFFYKSFVHQYAKFLGVDTRVIDAEVDRVLSADAPLPLPNLAKQTAVKPSSRHGSTTKYLSYASFVVILFVCSRIDSWWHQRVAVGTEKVEKRVPVEENAMRRSAPGPGAGGVSLASVSSATTSPAAVATVAAAAKQDEPAAPAGSRVELDLTATEETWVSVSSDGTPVFSGLLEANQTKVIEGNKIAQLRVGNAAGLAVRLNGKPVGPLGAHGQVRDLVFTSDKLPSHLLGSSAQPS